MGEAKRKLKLNIAELIDAFEMGSIEHQHYLDRETGAILFGASEDDHIRYIQATALPGLAQYANGDLEAADRSLSAFLTTMQNAGNILAAISTTYVLADIKMNLP